MLKSIFNLSSPSQAQGSPPGFRRLGSDIFAPFPVALAPHRRRDRSDARGSSRGRHVVGDAPAAVLLVHAAHRLGRRLLHDVLRGREGILRWLRIGNVDYSNPSKTRKDCDSSPGRAWC